jgi:tetratricopeptide (TPR) repeat protein
MITNQQSLMPADEGRRLRLLLMEAAEHLGKTRYAEAAQAYGRARGLCQLYRLPLEEAAVLFALAGVSLALGVSEKAVECYRQAAEIGREEKQFHVVAQA